MTKLELASQLTNAKNNYLLGLAALSLFSSTESLPILEKSTAAFGSYSIRFDQVAGLLRDQTSRNIALKEFLNSQLRALIKESFEIMKSYCRETGQSALLRSESWYQFARMIRNCISHNFIFTINAHDKTLLPVSWGGMQIEVTMDGQHLTLSFFGYAQAWDLYSAFVDFVDNRLC